MTERQEKSKNVLRVCPLNGATGLESPIVFLMGSHLLFEMEESVRLTETERAEMVSRQGDGNGGN